VKIGDVGGSIEAKASAQQGHYDESIPEREEWLGEIPISFVGLFRYRPDSFIGDNGEKLRSYLVTGQVTTLRIWFVWEKWTGYSTIGSPKSLRDDCGHREVGFASSVGRSTQ